MKLTGHAFHILAALADRDAHGSAIARWVKRETSGAVRLWPVTLYRTLDELVAHGLIVELEDPEERPEGASRKRRYYRLTDSGAEVLAGEAERREAIARKALAGLARGTWRS